MKIKFSINKYSPVLNTVGPSYAALAKFIIIHQYVCFPGEGYTSKFSFTNAEFSAVSSAPYLCRANVRVQ
jgi:hypothetical protein